MRYRRPGVHNGGAAYRPGGVQSRDRIDKELGDPAFRSHSATTAGPWSARQYSPICAAEYGCRRPAGCTA